VANSLKSYLGDAVALTPTARGAGQFNVSRGAINDKSSCHHQSQHSDGPSARRRHRIGRRAHPPVIRMEREYAELDTPTIAAMYVPHGTNVAGSLWASTRRVWPVPLPLRAARLVAACLPPLVSQVSLAAHRFGSVSEPSDADFGLLHATGIYRYSHNPQYLGLVLAALRWPPRSGSVVVAVRYSVIGAKGRAR
jgi:hypothetical protein